jgi:hypothetical protein
MDIILFSPAVKTDILEPAVKTDGNNGNNGNNQN